MIHAEIHEAVMALPPDGRRDRVKVNEAVRDGLISDLAGSRPAGSADLPECRLLNCERNHGVLDFLSDAIPQYRLFAADLLQRQLAAFVVQFFEAIKAVTAITHHGAGLADISELLGEFQQPNLSADNLLFGRHGGSPIRRGGALRNPDQLRAPPRLALCEGDQNTTVRLSFS